MKYELERCCGKGDKEEEGRILVTPRAMPPDRDKGGTIRVSWRGMGFCCAWRVMCEALRMRVFSEESSACNIPAVPADISPSTAGISGSINVLIMDEISDRGW